MNISKRLVTLLMCIAMVLSMMSNFALALGGAAGTTITDVTDEQTEGVVVKGNSNPDGNALTNGANPTSNVAAPTISDSVLVFDSNATEASAKDYLLADHFTDMSTGEALPDSANWKASWGVNLFSSWWTLLGAAKDNAVILIANGSNPSGTNLGSNFKGKHNISVYSPYFNVMPYDIADNGAIDGSNWTAKSDVISALPRFGYGDLYVGGEWNLYGIAMSNYANSRNSSSDKANPGKFRFVNSVWPATAIYSGYGAGYLFQQDAVESTAFSVKGSEILFKNVYITGTANTYTLFFGYQPETFTLDGVFFDTVNVSKDTSAAWMKQNNYGTMTVKNCNFKNCTNLNFVWQGYSDALNFTSNIFYNSSLGHRNTGSEYEHAYVRPANTESVIGVTYLERYDEVNIHNNVFISTDKTREIITSFSTTTGSSVFNFTGNYIGQGIDPQLDFAAMNYTPAAGSLVAENYCTTASNITTSANGSIDPAVSYNDYLDDGMTKKFAPTTATANNGTVTVDNGALSISWLDFNGSFNLSNLTLEFEDGVTAGWAETPAGYGTYTYNVSYEGRTVSYTVNIEKAENLFTDVYADPAGKITKDAILLDSNSAATASGALYEGTWKSTEYNFIKGTNVFASVKDIEDWAKLNGETGYQVICATKPQQHPSSTTEQSLYVSIPSEWYTENYDILPYTIGGDGVWSSNVGTAEGNWRTDLFGGETKHLYLGLTASLPSTEGSYGFYGFHVYSQFSAGGRGEYNLTVGNCYFDMIGSYYALTGAGGGVADWANIKSASLTVKDSYFYATATYQGRLFSGCHYNDVSLIGNLIEDGDTTAAPHTYLQQYTDAASFNFVGNYFKNYSTYIANEGKNKTASAYKSGATRTFLFEGNILDNSMLGNSTSVIPLVYDAFSEVIITGNVIKAPSAVPLIKFNASYQASTGINSNPLILTVADNHLTNVNGTFDVASNRTVDAENSVIENNYTTTDGTTAVGLYEANAAVAAGDYYFDSEMQYSSADVAITEVTGPNGTVTYSEHNALINYVPLTAPVTANDLVITKPANATLTWYSDAACTQPIADLSTVTGGNTAYVKSSNAHGSIVYTVNIYELSPDLFISKYVSDGIITKDAILLDSGSASTAEGAIYASTWKGTSYEFVKGVNVFATASDIEDWAKANDKKDYQVICKTEPILGDYSGNTNHLYPTVPSKWYSENYNVLPYKVVDGVWVSNVGTADGNWKNNIHSGFGHDGIGVSARTSSDTGYDPEEGTYEFYGFQVNYEVQASRLGNYNIVIGNCYLYHFYGAAKINVVASSTADKWENIDASVTVKDSYYKKTSEASAARIIGNNSNNGDTYNNFAITGTLIENAVPSASFSDTYFRQYTEDSTFVLSGNYFKDYHTYLCNEGRLKTANAYTSGAARTYVVTDNIFDNSSLQKKNAIINFIPTAQTEVVITGNKVKNFTPESPIPLVLPYAYNSYSSSTGDNATPLSVVIEDNHFAMATGTIDFGTGIIDAENSRICNNYMFNGTEAIALYDVDGVIAKGAYYLDSEMNVLNTDILVENVTTSGEGNVAFSNETLEIDYNLSTSVGTADDLTITVPQGTTIEWFADADCTEALLDLTTVKGDVKAYLRVSKSGLANVYTVTIVPLSDNMFTDKYEGYFDPSASYLLSSDAAGKGDGQIVASSWKGVEYDFVVGQNIFASVEAFEEFLAAEEITDPTVLITDNLGEDKLYVNFPSSWYTQNYDVNPVVKNDVLATEGFGADFEFNSEWNAEYDTAFGELAGIVIGRNPATNAAQAGIAGTGAYSFYGFKLNYDVANAADVAVDITLENTYFGTAGWASNPLFAFTQTSNESTLTVTNTYVKPDSDNMLPGVIADGNLGNAAIFDNMFIDVANPAYSSGASKTMKVSGDGCSITFTNSCFKNWSVNHQAIAGNGNGAVAADASSVLEFTNNAFINSMFRGQYNGLFAFNANTFTDVIIDGNYAKVGTTLIGAYDNGCQVFSSAGGDSSAKKALVLTITNNIIDGVYAQDYTTIGKRELDVETSVIDGNFMTRDRSEKPLEEKLGSTFYARHDDSVWYLYPTTWYTKGDLSSDSSYLQDDFIFNSQAVELGTTELSYKLPNIDATPLDLSKLISTMNVISVHTLEDCSDTALKTNAIAVPATGGIYYIQVKAPGSIYANAAINDEPIIIELTIEGANAMFVETIGKGTGEFVKTEDEKDYYWLSWRGGATLSGEFAIAEAEHRVGIIYYSNRTDINAIKDAIIAEFEGSVESKNLENSRERLDAINETVASTTAKAYMLNPNKTLTWDAESQTYGYVYNFSVPETYVRGAICYVIFSDGENYYVDFAEESIQQVTPAA